MKILLLYQGYPRLSQTYMLDEANELAKNHTLFIASVAWPIYISANESVPYQFYKTLPEAQKDIDSFKPEHVHGHFFNNAKTLLDYSLKYDCYFTLRTHSFDVLTKTIVSNPQSVLAINHERCRKVFCFPSFEKILLDNGVLQSKIRVVFPQINIQRYFSTAPNGCDIMSGGALLPKKNLKGYIDFARKLKTQKPHHNLRYYTVPEDPRYYKEIMDYNISLNSPVEFLTVQPQEMPREYKRHKYLVYGGCPLLQTVGYPLMIAEAQAAGVIVLTYSLRDDIQDYVTDCGYVCKDSDEVLDIILRDEDVSSKRDLGFTLASRYNIQSTMNDIC
jgi:glycosyltransferase involved in cell wall biosynthesis